MLYYEKTRSVKLTCRHCGISIPTLRKWWTRYQAEGEAGLKSRSRRPHKLRERKVMPEHEQLILEMRRTRHLGPKGLQRELKRLHQISFSTRTIWKVLFHYKVSVLRPAKKSKRYNRATPGDRVQMDNCKIGKKLYQFTAIDDCTRMRVLALYPDRSAQSAVLFLKEHVVPEFPFPIQRIQTDRGQDRGQEFMALNFQDELREQQIKFRPNRPHAPHLNGKVERSQLTDRMEFWPTVLLSSPQEELEQQLSQGQEFYNQERTHTALHCKTPLQRLEEVQDLIPTLESIQAAYHPEKESYKSNNHYYWAPPKET